MLEKELKTYRASVADRQIKYRAKKKQLQLEEKKSSTFMVKKAAHKSLQWMGKTINKCLKSLLCSPTKKRAVVSGVTNKIGLYVQQKWMILFQKNQKLTT